MRRIRSSSAAGLAAVLVLGACHGAAKKVDRVADRQLAKAAVSSGAELPGYSEVPAKGPVAIPAVAKQNFAKCLGTDVTIFDDGPGVDTEYSPDFSKQGAVLQSSVRIEPSKRDTDRLWNELVSTDIERCLQRLFADALKQDVTFDTLVSKFTVGVGDRSIGFAAKLSTPVDPGAFYVDLVFIARGRAAIEVMTYAAAQPFDRAQEIAVARSIYDRIGAHAN